MATVPVIFGEGEGVDEVQEVTAGSGVRSASSFASCGGGDRRLEVMRGVGGVERRWPARFPTNKHRASTLGDAPETRRRRGTRGRARGALPRRNQRETAAASAGSGSEIGQPGGLIRGDG
jgi:hypothetical protein